MRAQSQACDPVSAGQGAGPLSRRSGSVPPPHPPLPGLLRGALLPARSSNSPVPLLSFPDLTSQPSSPPPHLHLVSLFFSSLGWAAPPQSPPRFCSTPQTRKPSRRLPFLRGRWQEGVANSRVGAVISLPGALAPWPLAGGGERPL